MVCSKRCLTWNQYWQACLFGSILVLYLIIGGAIFVALESPAESRRAAEAEQSIRRANETILELILNISNVSEGVAQNVTNRVLSMLSQLAPEVVAANKALTPLWELGPAIFFTTTVVTTIGYGNIAPSTPGGQTFFVFYAIAGIPLALVVFSTIGTILSNALAFLVSRFKTKRPLLAKVVVITVAIATGLVLLVFIPSIIFTAIEGWTYRESVYYCFVSLTTVGFGDFVPGQSTSTDLSVGVRGVYKMCTACWLLFGIAFLALLIAEVQKMFTSSVTGLQWLCKKNRKEGTEEPAKGEEGAAREKTAASAGNDSETTKMEQQDPSREQQVSTEHNDVSSSNT